MNELSLGAKEFNWILSSIKYHVVDKKSTHKISFSGSMSIIWMFFFCNKFCHFFDPKKKGEGGGCSSNLNLTIFLISGRKFANFSHKKFENFEKWKTQIIWCVNYFFIKNNIFVCLLRIIMELTYFLFFYKTEMWIFLPSYEMFCFWFACFNNSLLINRWDMGLIWICISSQLVGKIRVTKIVVY